MSADNSVVYIEDEEGGWFVGMGFMSSMMDDTDEREHIAHIKKSPLTRHFANIAEAAAYGVKWEQEEYFEYGNVVFTRDYQRSIEPGGQP